MRLKLDTELREYVEFQCQDKIWDMRGIAADTVDGYGRIDNLINPLFWVGTDTNRGRLCLHWNVHTATSALICHLLH